jgi:hypothetical protein
MPHHYRVAIVKFPFLHHDYHKTNGKRLQRQYRDVNGRERTATYFNHGPAGARWTMEDGSILTIDYAMRTEAVREYNFNGKLKYKEVTSPWNPWTQSKIKNLKESWV